MKKIIITVLLTLLIAAIIFMIWFNLAVKGGFFNAELQTKQKEYYLNGYVCIIHGTDTTITDTLIFRELLPENK